MDFKIIAENIKIDTELLADVCSLELLKDKKRTNYFVSDISDNIITLRDFDEVEQNISLSIIDNKINVSKFGIPLNISDFISDLENVFETQKMINNI